MQERSNSQHESTKHPILIIQIAIDTINKLKCVLCEDKFETRNHFNIHLGEHLDEVRDLEVKDLLNGKDTFKCNTCDFMSRNHNAIKMHLVDHVNQSLPTDEENTDGNEIENEDQSKAEDNTK